MRQDKAPQASRPLSGRPKGGPPPAGLHSRDLCPESSVRARQTAVCLEMVPKGVPETRMMEDAGNKQERGLRGGGRKDKEAFISTGF